MLPNVKVFAHRGCLKVLPENSLSGFKRACQLGVDGIELDVHMTKDGEIVVIHDATLDRTTNHSGKIKTMTLAQLKEVRLLDVKGKKVTEEQIPTLKEVLDLLAFYPSIALNIELKTYMEWYDGIEEKVLQIVKRYGCGQKIIYSSFHLPTLVKLKRLNQKADVALLLQRSLPYLHDYVATLPLDGVHPSKKIYFQNPVQFQHIKDVRVWTVNDTKQLKRCLAEKVDAVITDEPEKALKLRAEIGGTS